MNALVWFCFEIPNFKAIFKKHKNLKRKCLIKKLFQFKSKILQHTFRLVKPNLSNYSIAKYVMVTWFWYIFIWAWQPMAIGIYTYRRQKKKTKMNLAQWMYLVEETFHLNLNFITGHVCCAMVNYDNSMTIRICALFSLLLTCSWSNTMRPIAYESRRKSISIWI